MEIKYNKNRNYEKELRRNMTQAERFLWAELKGQKLGYKFNRQQPIGIYYADFLCRKQRAVVEVDGDSHDGKGDYDAKRDAYMKSQGLIVIHIHDHAVKRNMEGALALIKKCIETRTSTEIVTRY